jgi:uncharacterized protein (TIGR03435 family)
MRFSESTRWTTVCGMVVASFLDASAQQPQVLEVASVRPSRNAMTDSNLNSVRGRLTATNVTVKELIRLAYSVKDYQLERAPAWLGSERFDIAAKSVSGSASRIEEEKLLVRELLADRFQLKTHQESKQMPVYLLVVAKGGPKLTPHNDAGTRTRGGCGRLVGRRMTPDGLATMLSRPLGREVLNRTGLSGEYDIQLDFTPDSGPCRGTAESDPSGLPSIYTALQQQLGLKLESTKGFVEILVVDHVERPSEN